jgi:ribosomal protein L27
MGRDYTIFATIEGYVVFETFARGRKRINVLPEQPAASAAQQA